MKRYENEYPVSRMCKVLGASKSSYYAWKKSPHSKRNIENKKVLEQIKIINEEHKKRYGSPKITIVLNDRGVSCGHNRVARIMRENGIRAKVVKKFRPQSKTISKHKAVKNILNRRFSWEKPDQAWVTDITYIPTNKGWVYLCIFLDLCTHSVVGWSVSKRMKKELVLDALKKACHNRAPSKGLIIHSDQGSQYGSNKYKVFLKTHGFVQSMSRRGNCWDNACAESFFRLIKVEELNEKEFYTINEVKYAVFCYIEHYYNRKRIHSSLGYKSPLDFERSLFA